MTGFNFGMMMSQENQIKQIPIDMLVPYHNHQFTLYKGERMDDMIESIRQNGVLTPIVVRPTKENTYEILIGHNRWNCAKLAGLETIPGIIKENLSDEEAEVYVIESNLIQRGFNDLKISERAKVLALRYEDMFSQGKRNDIINELMALENSSSDTKEEKQENHNSREQVAKEYGLSRNTVARLLRIDKLCDGLKKWVDDGLVSIRAGVELSYLSKENQEKVFKMSSADTDGNMRFSISEAQAKELRTLYNNDSIQTMEIPKVLGENSEKKKNPPGKSVKLSKEIYKKYFDSLEKEEVSEIVEKALEMYFKQVYGM